MAAVASAVFAGLLSGGHDIFPTDGREISISVEASVDWTAPACRLCIVSDCEFIASSSSSSVVTDGGLFEDCEIMASVVDGPVCIVVCMVMGWPCCVVVCMVIGTCVSAAGFTVVTPVLWLRANVI